MKRLSMVVGLTVILCAGNASAAPVDPPQTPSAQSAQSASDRTEVVVYPILAWLPVFGASFNLPTLPEFPNLPPGTGGGSSGSTDNSLNGAAMAGVKVESHKLVFQFSFLYAGLSADRQNPHIKTTTDISFGGALGGYRFANGLAVVGGVRRVALDIGVEIGDFPRFGRKPGIWDPLVGIDWRRNLGHKWIVDAQVLGGGFGVGADVDASAVVTFDWRLAKHLQLEFGYGLLYLKLSNGIGDRTFTTKQILNGPQVGIGIPF